jgi:hypothetical protein
MLSSMGARSLVVASLSILCLGCRPQAEVSEMPVAVRTSDVGWSVKIPLCGPDDGIARFDLFSGKRSTESRTTAIAGTRRVVELKINDDTTKSGLFNNDEVKVVSGLGAVTDLYKTEAFISTSHGFANFDTSKLADRSNALYEIRGRKAPSVNQDAERIVEAWCDGRKG